MRREHQLLRLRRWYARLLRLYPKSFRERFQTSMEQTFYDACRANASILWLFLDTAGGIMGEHMRLSRKSIVRAALVTLGVLLFPLWGVTHVDDWNWDWHPFVVLGALVFGAALTFEFIVKGRSTSYRFALGLAIATALVLMWMNFVLAVDVSLTNFMYLGVPVVGLAGAAIARLRARGMAFALAAMAIGQILVPLIAIVFWKKPVAGAVIGGNGVCLVLFAIAALLFRRAARLRA